MKIPCGLSFVFIFLFLFSNTLNGAIPILEDCPESYSFNYEDGQSLEFSLIAPEFYDSKGTEIISSNLFITHPDTSVEGPISFGSGENINFSISTEGSYTYDWIVTNVIGETEECQNVVEFRPLFLGLNYIHKTMPTEVTTCASGGLMMPINVTGIGEMNSSNGLYSVWLDCQMEGPFQGEISLVNPDGIEMILASSNNGSFPTYEGISAYSYVFSTTFTDCSALTSHDSPVDFSDPLNIFEATFSPVDTWSDKNVGINANGTWHLKICKNDEDIMYGWNSISMAFGPLCPSITGLVTTGLTSCDVEDGSVDVSGIDGGNCWQLGYAFSIDAGATWQFNSASFSGLGGGHYIMDIGYQGDGEVICTNSTVFSIEYPDSEPPMITGCPENIEIEVDAIQTVNWTMLQPEFYDDCNVESATITINYPDGAISEEEIIPGENLDGSYHGIGIIRYSWEVTDVVGNVSTCENSVEIIPVYTSASIQNATDIDSDGVGTMLGLYLELNGISLGLNGLNNKQGRAFSDGLSFTIVNENNKGIGVYNSSDDLGYAFQEGDELIIKGLIQQHNGLIEIVSNEIELVNSGNNLPEADIVTELGEQTESSLVHIQQLHYLDPNQWLADGSTFYVDVSNGNQDFLMRIDSNSELSTMLLPTAPFNLTGIGSQDDPDFPFLDDYEIVPRYGSDFETFISSSTELSEDNRINIYPVPARNELKIDSQNKFTSLIVYSLVGETLMISSYVKTLDLKALKQGVYFIKIKFKNQEKLISFVKI